MSLTNLTLLSGATITATGGTAVNFGPDGSIVNRGIAVSDVAEADVRTRDICVFKNAKGTLQSDGSWSKDYRSAKVTCPDLLPDGTQDFPSIEIIYRGSPLNPATKLTALKTFAAQILIDSDTAGFWTSGTLV